MADNSVPVGATNIAADDVGGILYQRMLDYDVELGLAQGGTFYRERLVAQPYSILADAFADGMAPFWASTVTNGGTTAVTTGEGLLQTSANALGTAQLISTAPQYYPGQVHWVRPAVRFGDTGSVGNVRRVGVFTVNVSGVPQDGFAYELNGTTLNAVTYKGGVATTVASTAWSNVAESPFTLDTNFHLFEIRWTANQALFYIDHVLRHATPVGGAPITNSLNLPMALQNINTSGATNRVLGVRNMGLGRFGQPPSDDESAYFRGRSATYRMPGRAGTTPRRLLAIWNAVGSGRTINVHQITLDLMMTAAIAVTVIPPIVRVHRITAIPTGGNAGTKVGKDSGGVSSGSISVFQDASADGTNSTTPLAATVVAGAHITQEWSPRLITAAGYEMSDRIELLVDRDVLVRPGEGLVLSYDGITAATQEPATTHTIATIDWSETA